LAGLGLLVPPLDLICCGATSGTAIGRTSLLAAARSHHFRGRTTMTFVNPQYLVETNWLAEHLDDPDLRIVDCTQYLPGYTDDVAITTVSGRENYAKGHIPGAAYVDLLGELSDRNRSGIYAPMPPAEQFAAVMGRIGVGDGTRVVLYDDFLGMYAARIWWMLRAFGFDDAAVLNGGWQKWTREGRPVATEPATYPAATFVPHPRADRIASKEDVLAAIGAEGVTIVNALLEPEYTGDPAFPQHYGRSGHIPGSVNVPFAGVVDMAGDTRFVAEDELRRRFADVGALDSERVITYCGGAIAASQTALLLTLLGQENVALYDGSMTEWGADPALPLVTDAMP
jgi:thiosulfate/3-mercaptopyruvate sulfurtransferase